MMRGRDGFTRVEGRAIGARGGFALPVALIAIITIGVLVTAGFYASTRDARFVGTDLANQAFYVAEYGLEEVIATTGNRDLLVIRDALAADRGRHADTVALAVPVVSGSDTLGVYSVRVRPLGSHMFLLTADGEAGVGGRVARRSVGSVVRITVGKLPRSTALATAGALTLSGDVRVRGEDAAAPGCAAGDPVAGVTVTDARLVDPLDGSDITGSPEIVVDPSLPDALADYGSIGFEDLMARATKVYEAGAAVRGMAPRVVTGTGAPRCDTSVRDNWGDPGGSGPCAGEVPIIHARGDLSLGAGTGQGILLVDGDLEATGHVEFYGVVIVRGVLRTRGRGNLLEGSVIVQGEGSEAQSRMDAGTVVQYSRCRVDKAFRELVKPRRLDARSWVDFTAMTRGA